MVAVSEHPSQALFCFREWRRARRWPRWRCGKGRYIPGSRGRCRQVLDDLDPRPVLNHSLASFHESLIRGPYLGWRSWPCIRRLTHGSLPPPSRSPPVEDLACSTPSSKPQPIFDNHSSCLFTQSPRWPGRRETLRAKAGMGPPPAGPARVGVPRVAAAEAATGLPVPAWLLSLPNDRS